MKVVNNKWILIIIICVIALLMSYYFFFGRTMKETISMGGMVIEEKHDHVVPGQYFEMWVIGYNAHEKVENRKRYKIFIEESMVYNLIEEGEKYMVSASSFREDDEFGNVYQLLQISNQEEYQLSGKGRIK